MFRKAWEKQLQNAVDAIGATLVLFGTIASGNTIRSPRAESTRPREAKNQDQEKILGLLNFVQNLDIAVHLENEENLSHPPPHLLHVASVEMAHSSNLIIGSTFNSAQGDFHIHNRDSESGMHNFRFFPKRLTLRRHMT